MFRDAQVSLQGESFGVDAGEALQGAGVQVLGGGREQDEWPAQGDAEVVDGLLQGVGRRLKAEDDRDGVAGPGADLPKAAGLQLGECGIQLEGLAEGAGEAFEVEGPDGDILLLEFKGTALDITPAAGLDDAGFYFVRQVRQIKCAAPLVTDFLPFFDGPMDDLVGAVAAFTKERWGGGGESIEEGLLEHLQIIAQRPTPKREIGFKAGCALERAPEDRRGGRFHLGSGGGCGQGIHGEMRVKRRGLHEYPGLRRVCSGTGFAAARLQYRENHRRG